MFKRKFTHSKVKKSILDRFLKSEKALYIPKALHLNEVTVCTINKSEKGIISAIGLGSPTSTKYEARPRETLLEKWKRHSAFESMIVIKKRIPMNANIIKKNLKVP